MVAQLGLLLRLSFNAMHRPIQCTCILSYGGAAGWAGSAMAHPKFWLTFGPPNNWPVCSLVVAL